eukprot:TRINITY_DN8767_c0_g1_i2.p1 TRINITY_DN8767_c0_g1~~TRINITY_DN8767_c0_g1_i2.p1  ORF type:complete len:270 (+),score=99.33 TRINITY_DN8767_c0_g1_i2:427-1236(+)
MEAELEVAPATPVRAFCNPIQNVRIKPPESALAAAQHKAVGSMLNRGLTISTPYHQDNAVCEPAADGSQILTCWMPLHDVTPDNGTLVVVPRSHRLGLLPHTVHPENKEVYLENDYVDRTVEAMNADPALTAGLPDGVQVLRVPFERGDVLFLDKLTVHASAPNTTDDFRLSCDFRYNIAGQHTGRCVLPGFYPLNYHGCGPDEEAAAAAAEAERSVTRAFHKEHFASLTATARSGDEWGALWHRKRTDLANASERTAILGRDRWLQAA